MFVLQNGLILPTGFFVALAISVMSAFILVCPRVPLSFVRFHVGLCAIPPIIALVNLFLNHTDKTFGLWHLDAFAWLAASFVLTIGLVVQRYSVRYLLGDKYYRKYFTLLTLTTSSASAAWLSDDLRSLLVSFGVTLLGLTLLIRMNREWQVARSAAKFAMRLFGLSWFLFAMATLWLAHATSHWELSHALMKSSLLQLGPWDRTGIALLLVIAVAIPAAQWPFQRWLLDSVVAPTPVSAVMHAGVVNAGGILLVRFAPLFSGGFADAFLIVLSGISVFLGTGIIMVQVDYKRQLVGSTIAQMGFMLVQCALGAYLAAIVHAVLHGLFKSALFLQAGSVAGHTEPPHPSQGANRPWIALGSVAGLITGGCFWYYSNRSVYPFISALMLGYSVLFAWKQFVNFGTGFVRLTGFLLISGAIIVFGTVPRMFFQVLHESIHEGIYPATPAVDSALVIFFACTAAGVWLTRHRSSHIFAIFYLWLVRMGEPHHDSVESHPKIIAQGVPEGGYK